MGKESGDDFGIYRVLLIFDLVLACAFFLGEVLFCK